MGTKAAGDIGMAGETMSKTTVLYDLDSSRYRLRKPIPVDLDVHPGGSPGATEVIARFLAAETIGVGSTEAEALLSLQEDIIWLYEDLVASAPEKLGKLPRAQLRTLRQFIEEIP